MKKEKLSVWVELDDEKRREYKRDLGEAYVRVKDLELEKKEFVKGIGDSIKGIEEGVSGKLEALRSGGENVEVECRVEVVGEKRMWVDDEGVVRKEEVMDQLEIGV